ncbi:phosphoribosyltransferase family protein [Aquidulcibacter sp.]|uniref:ComF family protein n=1 Tax=Aquidulcibacter sp. TaxID=2052990 RepID=UPI0028AFA68C|nr:phosphoribosyltransferase family protein [Aquidulcibacter sp.]
MAAALATRVDHPYNPLLLQRKRAKPSQNGLSASGRKRNVTGTFHVSQPVKGRPFVLVDDAMTTGVTLQDCTAALLRAAAVRVDCVALARVVRPTKIEVPSEPIGSPQELFDA